MPLKLHGMLLGREPTRKPSTERAPKRSWTGTSLGSSSAGTASSAQRHFILTPTTPTGAASGIRPAAAYAQPPSGRPPSGPPAGWSSRAAPQRSRRGETPPPPPEAEMFPGGSGDPDLDALDGLLRQASASLKKINKIREQLPSQPPLPQRRTERTKTDSFWKPRCRSDLWNEDDEDCWDFEDSDADSECGSQGSSVGIDLEEEALWEFLRNACGGESPFARKAAGTAGRASAAHGYGSESMGGTSASKSRESPPPGQASPLGGKKQQKAPPMRGNTGGFRFGAYGDKASNAARPPLPGSLPEAHSSSPPPEAKVSAMLAAAQAQGTDAVRRTVKEMLLKWHPDKAPQGDSPEAVAARAESTRVLRHVLQERKRLGL